MAFQLADLFEYGVDAHPDRLALVCGPDRRTFAELDARVNKIAHVLADAGVGVDDFVALYAKDSAQHLEAMLACYKIRAVPVNVNFRYVEDELRYLFTDAGVVAVLHDAEFADRVDAVSDVLGGLKLRASLGGPSQHAVDLTSAAAAASAARDFAPRSPDDLYICYTGGTTGMPKGVLWRHEDVFYGLGGGFDAYTNQPVVDDRFLAERSKHPDHPRLVSINLPPLMHGGGQWAAMRMFFEGNTAILQRQFDPAEVWRLVEEERATNIMMTGDAMGRPLIEALEKTDADGTSPDVSSLFVVASSAVVWSPAVKRKFIDRFPNAILVDSIGSTESGQNGMLVVNRDNVDGGGRGPTVSAGPGAVVVSEDMRIIEPGSGEMGRLARGGNIPLRYHNDPEKTAATFVTGPDGNRYAVTGDNALVEADGSITLLGRDSVCINSGGEKIFTEEVEGAVKAHPDVYDAIVCGVPDDRWGQRVAAVVQPRPGAEPSLESIVEHCRTMIAGYKVPREIHLVDECRRSAAGKPDYKWAVGVATAGA